jgi:DNA-binding MarR family transcriptional regulator
MLAASKRFGETLFPMGRRIDQGVAPVGGDARDRALDDLERAFGLMARKAGMPRLHERLSATAGVRLDPSSFQLIRRLEGSDPIRASDLAALMSLDLSTVSRQIASLEAHGLVERRQDPLDGRASLLELSARGRSVCARVCAARRELFGEFLRGWPGRDVASLAQLLTRFAHDMAAFADRPSDRGMRQPAKARA